MWGPGAGRGRGECGNFLPNFCLIAKLRCTPQARDCSLGGNKNQFAGKSPPSEGLLARGTHGGFYVANDTSQRLSEKAQQIELALRKQVSTLDGVFI
ncbi:hypothetical protein LYNGBM3L_20910 [Moorena producens 3L]|uniref:Uncharacterized protein n=1 Tax=Moorena producens 3L TaxID=489825 RepID=F4XN16_9CYAN|nr:hypothetical protein LYNGBM3L_20910 [Moorena producens 3L]OLT65054.1 hypothetical protein BI334_08425 [Moorena producens 3L]